MNGFRGDEGSSTATAAEPSAFEAPVVQSQPIPNAFDEATPEAPIQSDLEKSYDVTDPSEERAAEKAAEKTEPVTTEEKPGEGAIETIDDALFQRAQKFELSDEEIASFENNAALEKYVARLEKFSTKPETAVEQPVKKAEEAPVVPDFKIDLDPKEYDEKIVGTLNAMNEHYAKRIAAQEATFKAQFEQANQLVQEHQRQQSEAVIDGIFAGIKELKPFVGEKPLSELPIKSSERATRLAITKQAGIIAAGYQASKQAIPDTKTLIDQAARVVLGSKLQNIATEKVREGVAARQRQFIGRGTAVASGSDAKTPTERATEKVAELMKSRGFED